MAFGIPKAWSPGLALPQYVADEGLERHAFTTLQVPDGTYDNPAVGSGGYVVPQYVLTEGYGQGAAITKWAPRGSYFGPKIPYWLNRPGNKIKAEKTLPGGGTQFTLQSLGDVGGAEIHPAYKRYGDKAAATLIAHVRRAPPSDRKATMRRALDTIDPTLWNRTQTLAEHYQRQGMSAPRALHAGLSHAMSTGILNEVIQTGRRGKRPPSKGQLGLGCYGRSAIMGALGDAAAPRARHTHSAARMSLGSLGDIASTATITAGGSRGAVGPLQEGSCSPDGYIFKNGTWQRRLASGDVCTDYVTTRAQSGGATGGGVTVTTTQQGGPGDHHGPLPVTYDFSSDDASSSAPNAASQALKVGPFMIPMNAKQYTIHWSGQMPADWTAFIVAELAHDCSNCITSSMQDATPGHPLGTLRDFFGTALPSKVNQDLVSIVKPTLNTATNKWAVKISLPDQPIAMVSRPDTGEVWGMFMVVSPKDPTYAWDSTGNPYELQFWWRKKPSGVWDWIKRIVGDIIDIVGDALGAIAGLACGLMQSPGGKAGAVVGGAAVGGAAGAQAGAAGANIASNACGTPPPMVRPSDNLLPLVILGGAAAVAVMISSSRPRKKKVETPK